MSVGRLSPYGFPTIRVSTHVPKAIATAEVANRPSLLCNLCEDIAGSLVSLLRCHARVLAVSALICFGVVPATGTSPHFGRTWIHLQSRHLRYWQSAARTTGHYGVQCCCSNVTNTGLRPDRS